MISGTDRQTIRKLAEKVAEVASLPVHEQTMDEWKRLNSLQKGRPLVFINEIPWHEMNVNDELTLQCSDEFCRWVEQQLRTTLYCWAHVRGDMVVEPLFYSPLSVRDTGFGIEQDADLIPQDGSGAGIFSQGFHGQIQDEKDLEKLRLPEVHHDEAASNRTFERLSDLIGDILEIRKMGIYHTWFAPWDELIRWWGVQEALTDLVTRPELVHMFMDRLVTAHLHRLEQWKAQGLLSTGSNNWRVGSGGLGITSELPQPDCDPKHVRTVDQWGCATAQIFSTVSPSMHEEFALQYERRWLEKFGLMYYGCCEPLHNKLEILASIPNLRKISMSPWADLDVAAEKMEGKYVVSLKPSPSIFAADDWGLDQARMNLVESLEKAQGCVVEIIMKDISTVRREPQRLWEWSDMAREVIDQCM